MDEYIKREDAIKHLRGACIAKYPLSFSYGIFASADEISKLPTADVVPKSKVEALLKENARWLMEYANYRAEVNSIIEKAKQEVAREIFEEIEDSIAVHAFTRKSEDYAEGMYDAIEWVDSKIAELKKKYTEEKK